MLVWEVTLWQSALIDKVDELGLKFLFRMMTVRLSRC